MPSYIGDTCTTCGGRRPCRRHRHPALRLTAAATPPTLALAAAVALDAYGHPWASVFAAAVAIVLALRLLFARLDGPPPPDEPPVEPHVEDVMPNPETRRLLDESWREWRRNTGEPR